MKRQCPQCGEIFQHGQVYCETDGTSLVEYVPADPMLGKLVDERYLIERLLGVGGMGQVYAAKDLLSGRTCASSLRRAPRAWSRTRTSSTSTTSDRQSSGSRSWCWNSWSASTSASTR